MATTTYDPRPETLTAEQIAVDLTLSNEEGSSMFGYGFNHEGGFLEVEMYGDEGQIIKSYAVTMNIEEIN